MLPAAMPRVGCPEASENISLGNSLFAVLAMTESITLYDFFEDTLSSPLMLMTNCHISLGHCISQTMTIVWKVRKD